MMCEFCHNEFQPRPQVHNPRACSKSSCQKARQQSNEREWHQRHRGIYDRSYRRSKKKIRLRKLFQLVQILLDCFATGAMVKGVCFDLARLRDVLAKFFLSLGIQRANKFWKP